MTSVTAIITTYNRADILPRALASVLNQTRPADEIILIDDGSSDATADYLNTLAPSITCIRQKNAGISAARNTAIQHASSEWLAFLDDDDEWLPEKLEKQLASLKQQPEFRLCHSEEIWVRNGKRVNAMKKHKKQGGWIYQQCLPLCVISPSAVIIHRDAFNDLGLFDDSLPACEDYDLWLRICAQEPVLFIEQALIKKYGGHSDQLSQKYWGMDRFRILALEKMIKGMTLTPEQTVLTCDMLIHKISIYIKGASKRDKHDEVADYQQRLSHYQTLLASQNKQRAAC